MSTTDKRKCPTCGDVKELLEFNSQKKYCLVCHRKRGAEWRKKNPAKAKASNQAWQKKQVSTEASRKRVRMSQRRYYSRNKVKFRTRAERTKVEIQRYVETVKRRSKCAECGMTDFRCLEFHHPRTDKEFNIGDASRLGYSLARVKREIAKCIVLCANDHRVETYERRKEKGLAAPSISEVCTG